MSWEWGCAVGLIAAGGWSCVAGGLWVGGQASGKETRILDVLSGKLKQLA